MQPLKWSLALLVLATAATPVFGASSPATSIASLKPGRRIEVVLENGDRVIGRLGTVQPAQFRLEPDRKGQSARDLQYTEVKSVHPKMTRAKKWGIAAGIYLGLTTIGLILGG